VILIEESALPHERTLLLAVVATIAISVYVHGLTARPLTDRYVRWYESHPRGEEPGMERVPAPELRWRRPQTP
jgi:NhaP-type Na+/H+ or K+/H+ antiporter